jgi:hypothetical protein
MSHFLDNCALCHHGMARPQVANLEEGLQMWIVTADALKKQAWTAKKGWLSILEVLAWN